MSIRPVIEIGCGRCEGGVAQAGSDIFRTAKHRDPRCSRGDRAGRSATSRGQRERPEGARDDGAGTWRDYMLQPLERLRLTDEKIHEMAASMRAVAELPDPIGRVLQRTELDSGLVLEKITCPLGLLAVIFEARPDAVTQISALALKSGNAVILKPGREVETTAFALVEVIWKSLASSGLPEDAVSNVGQAARRYVSF